MIEIKGLHKYFGENQVLKGIDQSVDEGEVLCIIGPSGSGKSTMLRCINRLEEPTDGEIYMDGELITEENLDRITDGEVAAADKIILYAADDDLKEKAFDNLLSSTGLATMTEKFSEDMWTTYEIR